MMLFFLVSSATAWTAPLQSAPAVTSPFVGYTRPAVPEFAYDFAPGYPTAPAGYRGAVPVAVPPSVGSHSAASARSWPSASRSADLRRLGCMAEAWRGSS